MPISKSRTLELLVAAYEDRRPHAALVSAAEECHQDVARAVLESEIAASAIAELARVGRHKTDAEWHRWHALQAVVQHMRAFVRVAAGLPAEEET